MDALTLNSPSITLAIPMWVFTLIPAILGTFFMWRGGVNEAKGIRELSSGRSPTAHEPSFRRMGLYRVMGYLMLMVWTASWISTVPLWKPIEKPGEIFKGGVFGPEESGEIFKGGVFEPEPEPEPADLFEEGTDG